MMKPTRRAQPTRTRRRGPATAAGRAVGIAVLAAAAAVQGAAAQDEPFRRDGGDADAATDGIFSLPRSQDAIAVWFEARAHLRAGDATAAAERLAQLWQDGPRGVVPVPGGVDRWQGVRQAIQQGLRDLPPAGRERYEARVHRVLGADADAPLHDFSTDELRRLAADWPASSFAIDARLHLGDLALTAGDGITAQQHYRAARDTIPAGHPARGTLADRNRAAALLATHGWGIEPGGASDGDDALSSAVAAALGDRPIGPWAAYGGGYDGSRPMRAPSDDRLRSFVAPIEAVGFELNPFAMHPVGDLQGLYLNDGHSVWAIDPVAQELAWRFSGPVLGTDHLYSARDAINDDLLLSCAVSEDIVVAALQVPHDLVGAAETQRFRQSISIIEKIPARRLFAFDRRTGKVLWSHWDYEGGPVAERFRAQDACGAPLIWGDVVLCPTHDQTGAIAYYVSAYDLKTGDVRWRRHVCSSQQEVNMFGNANQEFASGPLAVQEGVVYGTTNLGICFACDLEDGDLRWVTAYDTIPLPRTQLRNQEKRQVFFANNPMVISDGVLATTPLDSEYAIGIDCETGDPLWELRHDEAGDTGIRWLLGALDGRFVFSGLGIIAVEPRPGSATSRARWSQVASREALGESHYRSADVPRGALTSERIWYVGSDGGIRILGLDGERDPRTPRLSMSGAGNLLMIDGIAVLCRDGEVQIHADLEGLVRTARERLERAPNDPTALLRVATLERALAEDVGGARGERAIEAYRAALQAATDAGLGPGARLYDRIAGGLFEALHSEAVRVAESDPAAGLELLRSARDVAHDDADDWLRAQVAILELVEDRPAAHLAELRRMASAHGDTWWKFDDHGRVPVGVWAAWQMLDDLSDPAERIAAAQQLAARHGDVRLGDATVRERAHAAIRTWLAEHGREAYAAVEQDAQRALANAGSDVELLSNLVERYPHSEAAHTATARLLDAAVQRGDLRTAVRAFADATHRLGDTTPGVLRRLAAAARAGDNRPLFHATAQRLRTAHADEESDFAPDSGQTYGAVFAELEPLPGPPARPRQLPAVPLAFLTAPSRQSTLTFLPLAVAPGFIQPERLPLAVSVDDDTLAVFGLDSLPSEFGERRFELGVATKPREPLGDLVLCGDVLVIAEPHRLRGVDIHSGEEHWRQEAGDGRRFLGTLGVRGGVLHAFSEPTRDGGDGGDLIGIEPTRGALLFRRALPAERVPSSPVASDTALWSIDAGDPALLRHDPLTGGVAQRTPLRPETLEFLGLREASAEALGQTHFACDDQHLYLPIAKRERGDTARVAAIEFGSGELAWRWIGDPALEFSGLAPGPDCVVIWERSSRRARVQILAADSGVEQRSIELAARANVHGWPTVRRGERLGDALLVSDRPDGWRLTCIGLTEGVRSFQQQYDHVSRVRYEPSLGPDFLAVPVRRQDDPQPILLVVERGSRATGALPDGGSVLTLVDQPPVRVYAHDRLTVVESLDGVRLLGARD